MPSNILENFPTAAPPRAKTPLRFIDIAVTATAAEFAGTYRGKQYHAPDFYSVLDRSAAADVHRVVLTGMFLGDIDFNLGFVRARPHQCSLTAGVHPYHARELEDGGEEYVQGLKSRVEELLAEKPSPISAFGELGLDYDHLERASREVQIRAFIAQLELISETGWDLPLFLHCRAAFDDFVRTLTPYLPRLPRGGVVHSFVGSTTQMQTLLRLGLDISVNGFSFQTPESLEMVAAVPLERLHLETDAPWGEIKEGSDLAKRYLTHAPALPQRRKRDKFSPGVGVKERNEPNALARVATIVAGIKSLTVEEVAAHAWQNSTKTFRLSDTTVEEHRHPV